MSNLISKEIIELNIVLMKNRIKYYEDTKNQLGINDAKKRLEEMETLLEEGKYK